MHPLIWKTSLHSCTHRSDDPICYQTKHFFFGASSSLVWVRYDKTYSLAWMVIVLFRFCSVVLAAINWEKVVNFTINLQAYPDLGLITSHQQRKLHNLKLAVVLNDTKVGWRMIEGVKSVINIDVRCFGFFLSGFFLLGIGGGNTSSWAVCSWMI